MGGAAASVLGGWLKLRRSDQRTLVGAGAGAAIAAAFGAPLAGAFYAFEIVIGTYTPTAIAPVAGAALAGALVAQAFGVQPYLIDAASNTLVETHHYLIYGGLGAICARLGIALMRAVGLVERVSRQSWLPGWARPVAGGALLIPVAIVSPQALSAGHGALHADLAVGASIGFILLVLGAKSAASIISLGFGFRGGLFFASLFLGTLLGHLFADSLALIAGHSVIDPRNAALVGMAAFAVAVVGGPMTMAMLILQTTHDFSLTGAVIAASLVSSSIVRELFGYSFSTWRLQPRKSRATTNARVDDERSADATGRAPFMRRWVPATMVACDRVRLPPGTSRRRSSGWSAIAPYAAPSARRIRRAGRRARGRIRPRSGQIRSL